MINYDSWENRNTPIARRVQFNLIVMSVWVSLPFINLIVSFIIRNIFWYTDCYYNKNGENTKKIPNCRNNIKIKERRKIDTPNTHIHVIQNLTISAQVSIISCTTSCQTSTSELVTCGTINTITTVSIALVTICSICTFCK